MLRYLLLSLLFSLSFASQTLQRSISSSPTRINPLLATDSASGEISSWIFGSLVKFDANGSITGDMAQSWEFTDDRTLRFHLKKGIRWHDGVPFTAADVLFTWRWLRREDVITPYKSDFKYVESVEAPDDETVVVRYSQPYFKALSIWMNGIIPEHLWREEKDPMHSRLNRMPVGTGPYLMKRTLAVNENIRLYANEAYYEHPPFIKEQIYNYIGDPSTMFMMLKSGRLDIAPLSPLQLERQVGEDFREKFNIYERPANSYTYIGFNLRKKPFNDPKLRKALSMAIDRKEIIDLLFFSHGRPCYGPFMPGSEVYPKDFVAPRYDPAGAEKLLAEAGYDKKHPLEFTLVTNTGNEIRLNAAQIIQRELMAVGVKMKIRAMEWQAFLNSVVFPHNFDAVLLGWNLSLIPDAYPLWHSDSDKKGGFNFVGYHNDEVDRLIEMSEKIVDRKKFARIYRRIFRLIVRDNPYIFLYIPYSITAVKKNIKGVTPSIIGIEYNFIDWKIED